MSAMPFGAGTLVIPFDIVGGSMAPPIVARMSRMRPTGELFRNGVAGSELDGGAAEASGPQQKTTRPGEA